MQFPRNQQTALTEKVMAVYREHHPSDYQNTQQRNEATAKYNRIFEAVYAALGEAGADTTVEPGSGDDEFYCGQFEQMAERAKRNAAEQGVDWDKVSAQKLAEEEKDAPRVSKHKNQRKPDKGKARRKRQQKRASQRRNRKK